MRSSIAADDVRQLAAAAHQLKSSSRSVGAVALGDLCAELENACRTGSRGAISQRMACFEAALDAADAQIGKIVEEGGRT
jgi:HPt (histidine-containing phosphotransfer) domain-containing protein